MSNTTVTTPLLVVSAALEAFREFTKDGDVQVQTIQIFLKIVLAGDASISYVDLEKVVGISQAAISRNIKKLTAGPRETSGYGLITVELDPYDSRRRIIKISQKGKDLVAAMEAKMLPSLLGYLSKHEVTQ